MIQLLVIHVQQWTNAQIVKQDILHMIPEATFTVSPKELSHKLQHKQKQMHNVLPLTLVIKTTQVELLTHTL